MRGLALTVLALSALLLLDYARPVAAQPSNTFSVSDITVVEGGSTDITVTLSTAAPSGGVAFTAAASYSTTGTGNAVAADVESVASALTISQGNSTGTLTVEAAKDTAYEGAETLSVTVTASTTGWGPASTGDNVSTVTIHDPVRFGPQTNDPSQRRAGIGQVPESNLIRLYLRVGDTISIQFPAAAAGTGNGTYTYALGGPERFYQRAQPRNIPQGLTFDAATRTLSGSPTGVDRNGVTTLGSERLMDYHVWDGSGEGGPDGDDNTEDNHDTLKATITICPAGSAAQSDGATACKYTAGLYSLEVSHGSDPATPVTLTPTFTTDTETYTASVAADVTAGNVAVIVEHLNIERVEMTLRGSALTVSAPGGTSGRRYTAAVDLNEGANAITVTVTSGTSTAHDKDANDLLVPITKTYTVTVYRGTGPPGNQGRCNHPGSTPPGLSQITSATSSGSSITVGWNSPTYGRLADGRKDLITNFIISVRAADGSHNVTERVTAESYEPAAYQHTITGLSPVTAYRLRIQARTLTACYSGQSSTDVTTLAATVNPPVHFSEEARLFLYGRSIEWKDGAWTGAPVNADGTITFPAAQGGTGTITYSLIDNGSQQPLADVASGITFDTATRKLGGTPAAAAQKTWAVSYWAEDENGSRAKLVTEIYAGGRSGGV